MPYSLIDFTGAGAVHSEAMSMMPSPMIAADSIEIMAGNDLGLINGGISDGKLQDPFSTFAGLEMPDATLLANAAAADMSSVSLTSAMPADMFVSAATTPTAPEWVV